MKSAKCRPIYATISIHNDRGLVRVHHGAGKGEAHDRFIGKQIKAAAAE